ncbi:NAD(P)-dependent oxidoreductase [Paraburkholderia solisilvae]|uniref:Glyoxylate/hydroxypyruvate reductase B n=1 Tax=Paraburkholderia solisilvae TaxID=624376 RepID=A0A6J5E147_9BURK|nr:NAD(P)-dependent oxidoreductase [Paraburkholderia solisilvae]CAB3758976.1 Glyoxylate/hydroxypyruvate reductase B [Paraburkholderia solisilvae]
MKSRIVVYKPVPEDVLAYLREHAEVVEVDGDRHDAFAAALKDADGAIGSTVKVTPAMVEGAPRLKALSTISVGYDAFDVADLTRRRIVLTHTPDVLTESTADTVFALILATARRVVDLAEWVKAGQWTHGVAPAQFGVDVYGKTLGIVGMGRIGGAVARRATLGFNMNVLYTNRSANPEAERQYGARRVELAVLLKEADFVCLQVPLSDETRHMIGARQLAAMKKSAILINAARGPVVDEAALIDALRAGTILAAGLDVFEQEPVAADSPLLSMRNVVALPHIGSATHETRHAMARCAAENLVGALNGTLTRNIVNREALAR